MALWRRSCAGLALVISMSMLVAGCQVDGSAQPNASALESIRSSATSTVPTTPATALAASTALTTFTTASTTRTTETTADASSTGLSSTRSSSTGSSSTGSTTDPTRPGTTTPLEDSSIRELPSTSDGAATVESSPTSPSTSGRAAPTGPTITLSNDGSGVGKQVTTIWACTLVLEGAVVGVRTIEGTAGQIKALQAGQVDVAQSYNSALLHYFDKNAEAYNQRDVDKLLIGKAPGGLEILNSTPAKDDLLLAVSTGTATKFGLRTISDLGDHLKELTLLLPSASSSTFTDLLSNYYGLTFPVTKPADVGGPKTVTALTSTASVGLMAASQYQIDDNDFVVLADPEHLFLPENFVPLVAANKLTPAMRTALNTVSAKLSVAALRDLRKKVAVGKGTDAEVADEWLKSIGLK